MDYSSDSSDDTATQVVPPSLPPPLPSPPAPPLPPPEVDALGRARRFGHVEGSWALTVYVPVPPTLTDADAAQAGSSAARYLTALQRRCPGPWVAAHDEAPSSSMPLHVSLSRTFPLREHQVDPFIALLRKELAACRPFPAVLDGARCLDAEDGSRRFAALLASGEGSTCGATGDAFVTLIAAVDAAVTAFGKVPFYRPPIPHASIAWMPLRGGSEEGDDEAGVAAAPPVKRARLEPHLQAFPPPSVILDACDVLADEQEAAAAASGAGPPAPLDPPSPARFLVSRVAVKCSTARTVDIPLTAPTVK